MNIQWYVYCIFIYLIKICLDKCKDIHIFFSQLYRVLYQLIAIGLPMNIYCNFAARRCAILRPQTCHCIIYFLFCRTKITKQTLFSLDYTCYTTFNVYYMSKEDNIAISSRRFQFYMKQSEKITSLAKEKFKRLTLMNN